MSPTCPGRSTARSRMRRHTQDHRGAPRRPAHAASPPASAGGPRRALCGSRLVTGSTELHAELEHELASFCGTQAALVFSTGFAANLGVLTTLASADSSIVSDAYIHASLIDGCRLSRASVAVAPHCDTAA